MGTDLVRRRWLLLGAATITGLLVAILLIGLIPRVEGAVGPSRITAKGALGLGRTDLLMPPLGSIEARTHWGPLSVNLAVSEVDLPALADQLESSSSRRALGDTIERDLRALSRALVARLLLGGVILGVVATALLPRRHWRYVVAGGAGGLAGMSVLVTFTVTSFSVEAFEEPTFTGALERAPVVIDALQANEISLSGVEDRFGQAADRLTDLMALIAEPLPDPHEGSIAILHISDVHSNPIGLEIARQLAQRFDVDAVLDTGDLTSFGIAMEARIGELVSRFDVPYVFVPGNHDSERVIRALSFTDGVTVLDGGVVEIAGIEILGFGDPSYTNWNQLEFEEVLQIKDEFAPTVRDRTIQFQPDVLAVHDDRIAEAAWGYVPLILSGHYHKPSEEVGAGTRSLVVGTTGASGLKSFTFESDITYDAEIIYFREGTAIAVDYVSFEGLGNDFVIERRTLDDIGPLEPPTPSPSPPGSP